jgi:hypothetical protein
MLIYRTWPRHEGIFKKVLKIPALKMRLTFSVSNPPLRQAKMPLKGVVNSSSEAEQLQFGNWIRLQVIEQIIIYAR